MTPKITVVIPFKDRTDLLRVTISSLSTQTYEGWNLILVDDGSTQESVGSVQHYISPDPRIRLISRSGKSAGPSACRNQGVSEVRTEYLMFLDSDDLLIPESLGRRVEVMDRNRDANFCLFSSSAFIDDPQENKPWTVDWTGSSDLDRLLRREWPLNVSSPVWRTDFFLEYGKFDISLPSWEDWELHLRVFLANPKYLRFAESDVLIRTSGLHQRLSGVQYKNSSHLQSASELFLKVAQRLSEQGLLSEYRYNLLLELVYGNAFLTLATDGPRAAIRRFNVFQDINPVRGKFHLYFLRLLWCVVKSKTGLLK